jgi:hypothetical protein
LAKYERTEPEKKHAQRGSGELRRKWEEILRRAGMPPRRMRRSDSVTGRPLWDGARKPAIKAFKATPVPTKPDLRDGFDRWSHDRSFRKGRRPEEIIEHYLEPESVTGIQGKHSWAVPRYAIPEWINFNPFVSALVAMFAASPLAAKQRASILYLFYRCEFTDCEIADELFDAKRKEPLSTAAVKKCRRRMVKRGDKLWAVVKAGLKKEGRTNAEKMISLFFENVPKRDEQRSPHLLTYSYPSIINANDIRAAYGQITCHERLVREPNGSRSVVDIKSRLGGDTQVKEFIMRYGDHEARQKFMVRDAKGKPVPPRKRMKDGNTPVVPALLLMQPIDAAAVIALLPGASYKSERDSRENIKHSREGETHPVGSRRMRASQEWLMDYKDALARNESDYENAA